MANQNTLPVLTTLTGNELIELKSGNSWTDLYVTTQTIANLSGGGVSLTVGTTPVNSGTNSALLFDNGGVLGNFTVTGDATLNTSTGAITVTSTSGTAFGSLATLTPGAGVATALGNALNASGGVVGYSGALGTPSSGVATNLTGTAASLTAGAVSTISGLITQGSNITITGSGTSGSPYSIASSGGGGSPGGSSGQVQYNNSGSFGGFTVSGDGTLNTSTGALTVTKINGSFTAHGILLGEGSSAFGVTAAMTDGQLLVGQTSADPLPKTVGGDATMSAAGSLTVTKTNGSSFGSLATLNSVNNSNWSGTVLSGANGGTGVANTGNTITLGGNVTTAGALTLSGSFGATFTFTNTTSVTFPTSGTLVNSAVATLSSLTSVGTIGTGTWQGTIVGATYGGTGINNGSNTLTINTNAGTIAFSGASTTMTFPSASDTLGGLATAQTWTAQNTHNVARTVASASGAALDDVYVQAATSTVTGTTTVTKFNKVGIYQPTFTDASAGTITDAATVYIDNAPAAGGSMTLTNAWALRVGAGNVKFPGSGNVLGTIISGTWNGSAIGATYLTPAGSNTQIQFNNSSAFGGSANLTWSSPTLTIGVQQTTQGALTLANTAAGSFATTLQSSNSASAAWTLTLPVTAGSNGYVLQTDGSGVTSWVATSGGGGTVTSIGLGFSAGAANILSNSGTASPITGSGTYTLAVTGTSGGIPYFSSTSAWTSSALLAANAIMIGGGAGAAPATTTTGTGVLTAIGNNVNASGGLATSAVATLSSLTSVGTIGTGTWQGSAVGATYGGTGINNGSNTLTLAGVLSLPAVAQGDLWYGSASNTISALAKNASATRYLANTGTSNNPAWAQIDLTTGVTGTLPVGNGGTGVANSAYVWVGANFGGM